MFTKTDLEQIKSQGSSVKKIEDQIETFRKGFPYIKLARAARINDGIVKAKRSMVQECKQVFETQGGKYQLLKFVPASGAASRMFKHLFEFMENLDSYRDNADIENDPSLKNVYEVIDKIEKFAFNKDLSAAIEKSGSKIQDFIDDKEYCRVIEFLLTDAGLDYSTLPKAFLKFHDYRDGARTALEEHFVEAVEYATSDAKIARLHFTISPAHKKQFNVEVKKAKQKYEKAFDLEFMVEESKQKPSTDTIAVGIDNEPFRSGNGQLLFRPGGHGALIENLNDLEADIVFIKNIDNVVPDRLKKDTITYKKVIGGLLIKLKQKADDYLFHLEAGIPDEEDYIEMRDFLTEELCIDIPDAFDFLDNEEKSEYLFEKLNRPIRVCGMVKNEGEPGGGPFWVEEEEGTTSLQIVESSQIDMADKAQKKIFASSTHFNPVDLVCAIKDYKGEKFDLHQYINASTGFISPKSSDGKDLKALELPGLWNGAMADWITVFVEVPISTFNPVKTINDLLRKQHQ